MGTSASNNVRLVEKILADFNRGPEAVQEMLDAFAPGARLYDAAVSRYFATPMEFLEFNAANFVNPRVDPGSIEVRDLSGGAVEARFVGVSDGVRGQYGEIKPTDQETRVRYTCRYGVRDGKVVSAELYSELA